MRQNFEPETHDRLMRRIDEIVEGFPPATVIGKSSEVPFGKALGGETSKEHSVRVMRNEGGKVFIATEKFVRDALRNTKGSINGAIELLRGKGGIEVDEADIRIEKSS